MSNASHSFIPNTPPPLLTDSGLPFPSTSMPGKLLQNGFTAAITLHKRLAGHSHHFSPPDAFCRDILALTWGILKHFLCLPAVTESFSDRLTSLNPTAFKLRDDESLRLQLPSLDLAWIFIMFDFGTLIQASHWVSHALCRMRTGSGSRIRSLRIWRT